MKQLMLLLTLSGCAAPAPAPLPDKPPPSTESRALPPAAPETWASKAVKRDTTALKGQARRFAATPGVPIESVVTLEPLTRNVNRALAVMELHHTRGGGYRPADIAAARAAAEAVAGFLATQGGAPAARPDTDGPP